MGDVLILIMEADQIEVISGIDQAKRIDDISLAVLSVILFAMQSAVKIQEGKFMLLQERICNGVDRVINSLVIALVGRDRQRIFQFFALRLAE